MFLNGLLSVFLAAVTNSLVLLTLVDEGNQLKVVIDHSCQWVSHHASLDSRDRLYFRKEPMTFVNLKPIAKVNAIF